MKRKYTLKVGKFDRRKISHHVQINTIRHSLIEARKRMKKSGMKVKLKMNTTEFTLKVKPTEYTLEMEYDGRKKRQHFEVAVMRDILNIAYLCMKDEGMKPELKEE